MVYTISQNHPECFFLALYHMSPGVENNILAKKYLREGQKICKLKEFILKNTFQIYSHFPPFKRHILNKMEK